MIIICYWLLTDTGGSEIEEPEVPEDGDIGITGSTFSKIPIFSRGFNTRRSRVRLAILQVIIFPDKVAIVQVHLRVSLNAKKI